MIFHFFIVGSLKPVILETFFNYQIIMTKYNSIYTVVNKLKLCICFDANKFGYFVFVFLIVYLKCFDVVGPCWQGHQFILSLTFFVIKLPTDKRVPIW